MNKRSLDQEELRQLRRYWDDPAEFERDLWGMFPEEIKSVVRRQVLAEMEAEGKHFVPGTESMWGGERAQRELARLRAAFRSLVAEQRDAIRSAVCDGLDYCARKRSGDFQSEHFALAVTVADALLSAAGAMPLPVTTIAVYLLRYGVLDEWCGCP